MRLGRLAPAIVALAACGNKTGASGAPAPSQASDLGGEIVARVGSDVLPGRLVAETASRQGVAAGAALDELIEDSLIASGARERELSSAPAVEAEINASYAKQMVLRIREAALAGGPPTDEEVAELTRKYWQEFDLPDQMLVIHAVVVRPSPHDAARDAEAKAVAVAIASSELSAVDAADFEARAKAVPHGALEVRVEKLEPFVADGRVVTHGGPYDTTFAAASAALTAPGATSGVVTTPFGWHVIRLIERRPGKHVPLEERRQTFAEEIRTRRADTALKALLSRLRATTSVDVANGVDDLLAVAFQRGTPPAAPDQGP